MRRFKVLMVLGCIAVVSCGSMPGGAANPAASYRGYGGPALVRADGRTVTIGPYRGACPAKVSVVARESATRVALFQRYLLPQHPRRWMQAALALVVSQVKLRTPLGSRELVDGSTGRALSWMSARLVLRPTTLPTGVRLSKLIPAPAQSLPESPGPAGCEQFYLRPGGSDYLDIVQSAGKLQLPDSGPGGWTAIQVRGQSGRAGRDVITWQEHGLTDYIVAPPAPPGLRDLTVRQLVAIADSALRR